MKIIFLSLIILFPSFASAQDAQTQSRLERIERDLNILQGEFFRQTPASSTPTIKLEDISDDEAKFLLQEQQKFQANMQLRFTQLEEALREINGKLEEQEFANRKNAEELRKLTEDVNYRFTALEQNKSTEAKVEEASKGDGTKQLGTVVVDPSKKDFVKEKKEAKDLGDPKKRYDEAFSLLEKAKYPEAQKAFDNFVLDFPDHELTSSAYFWLGESYFNRKNYELASVEYMKGYRKATTGPKAPDNLLKLGISLGEAKKTTEACTVFEKLGKEFPNAAAPIRRKAELERTKLRCGR